MNNPHNIKEEEWKEVDFLKYKIRIGNPTVNTTETSDFKIYERKESK